MDHTADMPQATTSNGPPPGAVRHVWMLTASVAVISTVGTLVLPRSPITGGDVLRVLLLTALVAVTERWSLSARVGHVSHRLTLSEVPLVLGAFAVSPLLLVGARLVGGIVGLQVRRRQAPYKTAYNVGYLWIETLIVLIVLDLLGASSITGGPRASLAIVAIAVSVAVTGAVAKVGAISATQGRLVRGLALRGLRDGLGPSLATAAATTVGVVLYRTEPTLLWAPAVVLGVLMLAYRSHVQLVEAQDLQSSLIAITQGITGESTPEETAMLMATATRRILDAPAAAISLADPDTGRRTWYGADADSWTMLEEARLAAIRAAGPGARHAPGGTIAAPVDAVTDSWLVVGYSRRSSTGEADRQTVGMLANHAAVALANAHRGAALRAQAEQATFEATHDPLTGLANRAALIIAIEAALVEDTTFAVLLIDLDNFKEINDALGHAAGDKVLGVIGQRLTPFVDEARLVCRLGGDEFAVIIDGGEVSARDVAGRIRDAIGAPVQLGSYTLQVGCSVGIATYPHLGRDADELMTHADLAMYEAKARGGGVAVFGAAAGGRAMRQLAISSGFRSALGNGDINLVFQPLVDLQTDRVVTMEALSRWTHPDLGPVSPEEFVRVAEQSGLITDLTHRVLDSALSWHRRWLDAGEDLPVSVNVSATSLLDTGLPRLVATTLDAHGVRADRLTLELTESSVIGDPQRTLEVLARLQRLGVRTAIDDFGTGYSSLAYLAQLPVDEVKIDKSFVLPMLDGTGSLPLVAGIIRLCTEMGFDIVAEGIETDEIQQTLRDMGCTRGQGFGIARPMGPEAVVEWVRRHHGHRTLHVVADPARRGTDVTGPWRPAAGR